MTLKVWFHRKKINMKSMLFRRRLISVFLGSVLLIGLDSAANALRPDQIFAKVSSSIVEVLAGNTAADIIKQGSGVVIKDERVVTNCHVLTKTKVILVKWKDAELFASLEYPDIKHDLCEIKVPSLKAPAVSLAPDKSLRVGQAVYAIGNPLGLDLTLSNGLISSFRHFHGMRYIQTNADFTHGSSGGGLFDSQGRLIGITTSFIKESGIFFAIPASNIRELPKRGKVAMKELLSQRKANKSQSSPQNGSPESITKPGNYLSGAQIKKIFRPGLKMHANPHGHPEYTITINGVESATRDCGLCNLTDDDGQMKINFVAGQVCFDWDNASYPTSGCYRVEEISGHIVRLHLANGKEITQYMLEH